MNINIGQAKIAAKGRATKKGSPAVVIAIAVAATGRKVEMA